MLLLYLELFSGCSPPASCLAAFLHLFCLRMFWHSKLGAALKNYLTWKKNRLKISFGSI